MKIIAKFDFGNMMVTEKPGYIKVERVYSSPRYLWINELSNVWRREVSEGPLRDFVKAKEGEFRMGLPKGEYLLKLFFYDPLEDHGPFDIKVSSVEAKAPIGSGKPIETVCNVRIEKGVLVTKDIRVNHTGSALALNFSSPEGGMFMINALEVQGPEDAEFTVLFPDAPSDILPSIEIVESQGRDDTTSTLKEVCEWMLDRRTSDGFLGDYEGSLKLWYTTAYPIRTFLAAYNLFGERKYLDAVVEILDKLVVEQMPEGAFTQCYRNQPTNTMTEEALEAVRARLWMNLADVGSIVTALTNACFYVSGTRKDIYIDAVRNYCDNWAIRFQHENGGFNNGWLAGRFSKNIYSVATANTALTLSMFSKLTNEIKYMESAERALAFLIKDWNEDGRPLTWPADDQCPDKPHYQNVLNFGDLLYTHEGIIGTSRLTKNTDLRRKAFEASRKHLFGCKGLLAGKKNSAWWPVQDSWTNSKSVGMPIVLLDFLITGPEFGAAEEELKIVRKEYKLCKKFLCTSKFSSLMGVMLEDPDIPWAPHGIQSWSGCSVAATGFAGIALAEMVKPGITTMSY